MRILFIQLILPLATYFIGVLIGRTSTLKEMTVSFPCQEETDFDPEDLQHVGYSPAECGRDK